MHTLSELDSNTSPDDGLERDIAAMRWLIVGAADRQTKAKAFSAMCKLIRLRSPERVHAMESAKGLLQ